MKKRTSLPALAALVFCTPALLAQSANREAALPGEVLGPQLVAWSQMQTPHPVPQPLPERPDPQKPAPTEPQAQQPQPTSQFFTGMIMKDHGKFVLQTADTTYQIDDQEQVKTYEGRRVKVSGTLDAKTNLLHVATIDLIS